MRPEPASARSSEAAVAARPADDPRLAVWLALGALAAAGWVLVLVRAGGGAMGMGGVAPLPFLASWVPMMAAMMLPSVVPAATLWMRSIIGRSSRAMASVRIALFLLGYLAAWTGYGLIALAAGRGLARLLALAGPEAAPWIGAAILGSAGIYQLTPVKDRCLRECRSPIGQVLRWAGLRGGAVDLRAGLSNGAWCVACCWGLMAVLLVVGTMNLAAMVALAAVVFAEKVWRRGRIAARLAGVALLGMAAVLPVAPWLAPALSTLPRGSM